MECFLHYRCTDWSWCLLQAQRSTSRAVHGFTLQLQWCNTHRLWSTDSGDNHWSEESQINQRNLYRFDPEFFVSWCLLCYKDFHGSGPGQGYSEAAQTNMLLHTSQTGLQNISHCSQNNQIKASPLCMQREQHFLWMDGHSLFSSQSLT